MLTTLRLIDLIRKQNNQCSLYRVAKLLEVRQSTVLHWTSGRSKMSEATARRAAQLLDLDRFYVLACIHAEQHEGDELYPEWLEICEKLAPEKNAA